MQTMPVYPPKCSAFQIEEFTAFEVFVIGFEIFLDAETRVDPKFGKKVVAANAIARLRGKHLTVYVDRIPRELFEAGLVRFFIAVVKVCDERTM